jgi:hypothetical protein
MRLEAQTVTQPEIESQEEGLESLRLTLENVKSSLEGELSQLRKDLDHLQATSKPSPSPTPSAAKSPNKIEIPMKAANSLDGIISHLTQKHGGNVQEKGIVTITSKSVINDDPKYALKKVADLTSDSDFWSNSEPGQWICWDFGEMRVRPTHYTIKAGSLKSWVVEGSLDGGSWTEIDRQTDNQDFWDWRRASFAVSNPAEFRFIRLTQTGKDHDGADCLYLRVVEFFGTLSE